MAVVAGKQPTAGATGGDEAAQAPRR
ncbi:MAG: hypothetical protein K0R88_2086, partial [Solirubrobacterales bacterium]|nr:hypothetical protein [Solirubrobacterales bacterium]